MPVEFKNNGLHVKAELNEATRIWLEEASGIIEGQTKQNTVGGHSGLRDNWTHVVDDDKGEAIVGHPWQLAIWYELGTGSFAQNGDGRKGWWVYVKDGYSGETAPYPSTGGYAYTEQEAKRVAMYLRSKGLDAHATNGMHPKRPLQRAFESTKESLRAELERKLKGMK